MTNLQLVGKIREVEKVLQRESRSQSLSELRSVNKSAQDMLLKIKRELVDVILEEYK